MLDNRLDRAWLKLFELELDFADEVASRLAAGFEVAVYRAAAIVAIATIPGEILDVEQRTKDRVVYPRPEQSAAEQAAADARLAVVLPELERV